MINLSLTELQRIELERQITRLEETFDAHASHLSIDITHLEELIEALDDDSELKGSLKQIVHNLDAIYEELINGPNVPALEMLLAKVDVAMRLDGSANGQAPSHTLGTQAAMLTYRKVTNTSPGDLNEG